MKILNLERVGSWLSVLNGARTTVNKEEAEKEPSSNWKRRILLSEHSPIRKLLFNWKWTDLPYWVSVHLVRHKFGIEHFVRTQRTDRTGIDRDSLPQGAEVEHEAVANAQALINISRKRLCRKASPETQKAWKMVIETIKETEPELASVCVPECVYRNGLCPEMQSCGFNKSEAFKYQMREYLKGIEHQVNPIVYEYGGK